MISWLEERKDGTGFRVVFLSLCFATDYGM